MSGTSTPNQDTQLLEIGKQCSSPTCHLIDFLPFKCQHCAQPFCGDHFLPTAHHCEKYDAARHDRVAPSCPLCNTPVAIPPGQDPNIGMERHINVECSVMTGRSGKAKSTPTCARPKCGKVLFSPIRCDSCRQQFCPQHRFPADHSCSSTPPPLVSKAQPTTKAWTNVSNQTSAASAAAMAAIKRAAASSGQSKTHPAPMAKASSSSSRQNPFSATERRTILLTTPSAPATTPNDSNDQTNDPPERCSPKSTTTSNASTSSFVPPPLFGAARAKAERESRRKAIQERARKGLPLSEEEKAFLAAKNDKEECLIM